MDANLWLVVVIWSVLERSLYAKHNDITEINDCAAHLLVVPMA